VCFLKGFDLVVGRGFFAAWKSPLDKHPVRGSYINTDTSIPDRLFVVFLCSRRRMPNNTRFGDTDLPRHLTLFAVIESFVTQAKNE